MIKEVIIELKYSELGVLVDEETYLKRNVKIP